ncbi:MAG: translation initiation factor IF-2 N-terminal domain-containing protein, partial [Pirellulales bacterium]
MPVRIYSLAKELKLDSQELSDICAKAGITGKGSALASLTDEEAEKLKQYIASGGKAKAVGGKSVEAATDAPVRREDYVAPTAAAGGDKRPKVLASPAPKPKPPKLAEPAKPPQKESAPEPIVEPPADEPKRPEPIELRGPLKQIRELRADRKDQDGGEGRTRSRPAAKSGPRLNLAPMPAQPIKKEQPKDAGPAPQKPDIKLSPEAMRGGKSPLSEHMRKHEQKRQDTPQQPLLPADAEARARERRRKEKEAKDETLLGTREQRQMLRKQQQARRGRGAGDEDTPAFRKRRGRKQSRRGGVDTAAPRKQLVSLQLPATLREFSEATGVTVKQVQGELLQMGTMASINTLLDEELIELLMVELGVEVELRHTETLEDKHVDQVMDREDSAEDLEIRPPVITFLGHVDHGKTSLLDKIIGIDVVSGESGGITQHIRAYEIEKGGRKLSFVDTPGHEAFTEMRARGANVTDIAVLVVAADDGVMPQTEEAISHARAAGVPIVIALNKIDLPDVDENRIFQQLAQNELLPTDWGGETEL